MVTPPRHANRRGTTKGTGKERRKEQYGNGTTLSSQGVLSIDDILFDGFDSILFNAREARPFNMLTFPVCETCKEPLFLWFHTSLRCPCLPHACTDQSAARRPGLDARHVIRPETVEHLHVRVRGPFNARRYVGATVLLLHYDL